MLGLLLATWTLAALGEEAVFRACLPTRTLEARGTTSFGVVTSVLGPALLVGPLYGLW